MKAGRRGSLMRLGGGAMLAAWPWLAPAATLERVRERGTLKVAVYEEMPPFYDNGRGIEAALAQALADALGLKLSLLPFSAGENMGDDLRNMVWRGHYLGYGPADVLLHVPVDAPLMQANPRVSIFAPYYRERVVIAVNSERLPALEQLSQLRGQRIAVPGSTLAGWLLIGAEGGAYREQLSTHWKDGVQAAQALRNGEVAAAAGLASELESVLADDPRFVIAPLPLPRAPRDGWVVGLAVERDATDLAAALQGAVNTLAANGGLARLFAAGHVAWRPV